MIRVQIAPDWEGWRAAARALLAAGVPPTGVEWEVEGEAQAALLLGAAPLPPPRPGVGPFRVPGAFVRLADAAACHRDADRWAFLYRVLWRLTQGEPRLMEVATDPDVHRLLRMEKSVRRASHKMKAFVRFRAVELPEGTHFVAWFEPEHDVARRVAPFFAERFASMDWVILTPDRSVAWSDGALAFGPGLPRSSAPAGDALEELWRTYYASTFNPARVRISAMRAEMPLGYWKNLPEAALIQPLIQDAPRRVREMIERQTRPRAPREGKRVYRSREEKERAGDRG